MPDEQKQTFLIVFWKKAYFEEIVVIFKRKLQNESEKQIQKEIALLALGLQTRNSQQRAKFTE